MPGEQNIRLLLEYDGTAYAGWQLQSEQRTIQGELEAALSNLIGEVPVLRVAGRTDAGVHAIGQVSSFTTTQPLEPRRYAPGLNHFLPNDISVHTSTGVPLEFDARQDSLSKRYRYRVYIGPQPAALELCRAWQLRRPLQVDVMRQAAAHLVGRLDFEAFRSAQCDAPHARRHMYNIEISQTPRPPAGEYVDLVFWANAYCRHMCRILAGTLVEVGLGKRSPAQVQQSLKDRDRAQSGMTAPACGLTLLSVEYP